MSDSLRGFPGFSAGKTRHTPIPNEFFSELLPVIDDLAELKVVLYVFWRLGQGEGDTRYVRLNDALADILFLEGMGGEPGEREQAMAEAFKRAAQRGALIEIEVKRGERSEIWYFLNSDKGRQAVERLSRGEFEGLIHDIDDVVVGLEKERPNVFLLYEQNIGMVTPMVAEKLRQAERDYPQPWLTEAFSIAVANNKRNWAYISAILQKWAQHGKDTSATVERTPARNDIEGDRRDPSFDWDIIR
ncbi:MAG: DnaD domain protein [Caldilineales bacterium]|nr:DnaD domain protein [Caldilineales bacterium]